MPARLFLLLATLAVTTKGLSQTFPAGTWGTKIETEKTLFRAFIVGWDSAGTYVLKERPTSSQILMPYSLERISGYKAQVATSVLLKMKIEKERCIPEQVLQIKGKTLLVYSMVNQRGKEMNLCVRELDRITLQPLQGKILHTLTLPKGNFPKGRFMLRLSRDSSKLLLVRKISNPTDSIESFWVTMTDENLTPLWGKKIAFPSKPGRVRIESLRVTDNGKAILLVKGVNGYYVLVIQKNADELIYPIIHEGIVTSLQMELMDDHNLTCAGLFSERDRSNSQGFCITRLNLSTGEVLLRKASEFDPRFILQDLSKYEFDLVSEMTDRGEKAKLIMYSIDRIRINEDGGGFLIGEQRFTSATPSPAAPPTYAAPSSVRRGAAYVQSVSYAPYFQTGNSINTHYISNDIVVAKFDSKGEVEWTRKISKTQNATEVNKVFLSYMMLAKKDRIGFIFNDHPRNPKDNALERPVEYIGARANLVMVTLDLDGRMERRLIHDYSSEDVTMVPLMSRQVSLNKVIFFGQRHLSQQLASMTID